MLRHLQLSISEEILDFEIKKILTFHFLHFGHPEVEAAEFRLSKAPLILFLLF